MAANKKLQEKIFQLSEGVLSTAVDVLLYFAAFSAEMMLPQRPHGAAARASEAAISFLEEVNYHSIKNALQTARKKGWLTSSGSGKRAHPEITQAGRKRLKAVLPFYDEKRIWDERLYLVTYDIPEEQSNDRQVLREYLKKIGCGMLQKSVWITPYNPRETLADFIRERNLKGAVIISDVGRDGSIGQENINSLVGRIYHLEKLNKRYQEFLQNYEGKEGVSPARVAFSFMSILKDDPQLPFSLLPSDWLGEKAYQIFREKQKRVGYFITDRV